MKFLLDANVLIALFDNKNTSHKKVKHWFIKSIQQPNYVWLSCAITQMACLRILSLPSYPADYSFQEIQQIFHHAINSTNHQFVSNDLNIVENEVINWRHLQGHRQLTDAYLLALAIHNNAKFVTLDNRIDYLYVKNAQLSDTIILD